MNAPSVWKKIYRNIFQTGNFLMTVLVMVIAGFMWPPDTLFAAYTLIQGWKRKSFARLNFYSNPLPNVAPNPHEKWTDKELDIAGSSIKTAIEAFPKPHRINVPTNSDRHSRRTFTTSLFILNLAYAGKIIHCVILRRLHDFFKLSFWGV